MLALVGTYTRNTDSAGIYAFAVTAGCRDWALVCVNEGIENPSWLVRHPVLPVIYAANEIADSDGAGRGAGGASGEVSAFSLSDKGKLECVSRTSSLGADPCHLAIDAAGESLIVSNYSGGSFTTYGIDADGSIGEMASFVQHYGKGVDPMRQKGPHVHSVALAACAAGGVKAYIADLGTDRVMSYPISPAGIVDGTRPKPAHLKPGAGPRLMCLDSSARYAYLINELDNTIVSFEHDASGGLTELETVSTLPGDFDGASYCAHLQLSADDRFLYASNRGHDSIVVFETGPDGQLTPLQFQPTLGNHPRHFALSPDGAQLIAANRGSNNIVVFDRDQKTGRLTQTGAEISTPAPVCVLFC